MNTTPTPLRIGGIMMAAALAVAACSSAAPPGAGPSAGASVAPTQAATPTPAPTPTAIPDAAAPFEAAFAKIDSGIFRITGSITIGDVETAFTGTDEFDGEDSRTMSVVTAGERKTTTEKITVSGKRYVRNNLGPWLEDASASTDSGLYDALAARAATVSDTGLGTRNGITVHEIAPSNEAPLWPGHFGLDIPSGADVLGELTFYAEDDGTPVGIDIALSWTGGAEGAETGSVDVAIDIDRLGDSMRIAAPPDVWNRHVSTRWAYSLAYPHDWEYVSDDDYDEFDSPIGAWLTVVRTRNNGSTLNQLSSSWIAFSKKEYKPSSTASDAYTLDGVKARLITLNGGTIQGCDCGKLVIYSVLVIEGRNVYVISWLSPVGNEDKDVMMFKSILAQFSFT